MNIPEVFRDGLAAVIAFVPLALLFLLILIVGLMDQVALPSHLQSLWKEFPTVVTGVRTRNPVLSFSAVDHHALVMGAFERHLIADHLVWVREGHPRIVTWDSDGMIYTVVSNLPDQQVGQFLEDLPAPPKEPTALDRVRSGLVRMSSLP